MSSTFKRGIFRAGALATLCAGAVISADAGTNPLAEPRFPAERTAPGTHPRPDDMAIPRRVSVWHITDVQLKRGGFRPCSDIQSYSFADPYGARNDSSYDNPTLGHRKCIIAEVTMSYEDPNSSVTTEARFAGYTEAWGVSIPGDFRSNRPPYAQTTVYYGESSFQAQGSDMGVSISNSFDAAVTYYDTALEQTVQGTQGFGDSSEPPSVREHLQTEGAEVRFFVPGVEGSDVFCHYREGQGPRPDSLNCPGLTRRRFNEGNRLNGQ